MDQQQSALMQLGRHLQHAGYAFVTPTPETHRRVLHRDKSTITLKDIFGWSRPFETGALPTDLLRLLDKAGALAVIGGNLYSTVRFSSLGGMLFAHSCYPTSQSDAVFFGPDTYRFARAIRGVFADSSDFSPRTVVDIGAGSGAGGLFCASQFPQVERVVLCDINDAALRLAEVNAALNGITSAEVLKSDILAEFDGSADLIVSNPPYLVDGSARAYRHGGGRWGGELSVRILQEGIDRLAPGGRFLLYTGAVIVDGADMFLEAASAVLAARIVAYRYEEIDPDVFGEELEHAPYDAADRIAAVMLTIDAKDVKR